VQKIRIDGKRIYTVELPRDGVRRLVGPHAVGHHDAFSPLDPSANRPIEVLMGLRVYACLFTDSGEKRSSRFA
jgi:hypothetical protein